MASYKATVYDPPASGFPFLAVVVDEDSELLAVKSFDNREEAFSYLKNTFEKVRRKLSKTATLHISGAPSANFH